MQRLFGNSKKASKSIKWLVIIWCKCSTIIQKQVVNSIEINAIRNFSWQYDTIYSPQGGKSNCETIGSIETSNLNLANGSISSDAISKFLWSEINSAKENKLTNLLNLINQIKKRKFKGAQSTLQLYTFQLRRWIISINMIL